MGDGEHFFSQSCHLGFRLHSPLQISQCYEELRFLRLVVAVLLSEWWCDLSCRYWPATIRLFIEVNHSSREWCLSTGCWLETWNLWFCHSAKQHSLPRSPPRLPEASLGFEYIPNIWLHKWNEKMLKQESVMSKNYEKTVNLWHPLAGDLPKTSMKGSKFVASGRSKSWLGSRMLVQCLKMVHSFPSWIGLSLSHPTRPCDAQKGHGWEHR